MVSTNRQTVANRKWQKKNANHAKYLSDRSRARTFIKTEAAKEDLDELISLINQRKEDLESREDPR